MAAQEACSAISGNLANEESIEETRVISGAIFNYTQVEFWIGLTAFGKIRPFIHALILYLTLKNIYLHKTETQMFFIYI